MKDKSPIKIIDVIMSKRAYGAEQTFVVIDRMPEFIYIRSGKRFTACDSGFYRFLAGTSKVGDAFAGRKFTIKLDDGSEFQCNGDVWSICTPDDCEPLVDVGIATIDGLKKCYVFNAGKVSKRLFDDWIAKNEPSPHYYKYDVRCTMEWANKHLRTWGRPISAKRARKIRKSGRNPWKDEAGNYFWSPAYERKVAEILEMSFD